VRIPGKHIKGLDAGMPCEEAARRVLAARLEAVRLLVPLAAGRWREDVEHVHQLRVSTRRAASAMGAFEPCLKKKRVERVAKALRRLRRAAGEARDADVHLAIFEDLLSRTEGEERAAVEHAIASIRAERERVQPALVKAADKLPDRELGRRFGRLLGGVGPAPGAGTLGELASRTLAPLATGLREAAEPRPWTIERLHEVRIAAKKLRYACEVFRCCLDEETDRAFTGEFVALVDALGEMNDASNMAARIEAAAGTGDAELAGLRDAPPAGVAALIARFGAERDRRRDEAASALERLLASELLDRLTGVDRVRARSA
jgi:CHAD domain-containing protein